MITEIANPSNVEPQKKPAKAPSQRDLRFDSYLTKKNAPPGEKFPVAHGRNLASGWRNSGTASEIVRATQGYKRDLIAVLNKQGKTKLLESLLKLPPDRQEEFASVLDSVYKNPHEASQDNYKKVIDRLEQMLDLKSASAEA